MENQNKKDLPSDGSEDGDKKPAARTESESKVDEVQSVPRKRKGKEKSNHALRWEEMYNRLCDFHSR